MSNLGRLVKIESSRVIYSLFKSNKKNRGVNGLFYLVLMLGLLFVGLAAFYSFIFTSFYIDNDLDVRQTIFLFGGIASMLTFVSATNQTRGLYIGDDYDLLTTLPLKKSEIISSKLIILFVFELLFSLSLLVPHGVMLLVLTHDTSLMLITFLIAFFVPVVPIALGALLSLFLTIITAKFKHANVISIVLYFIFFAGIFFLSFMTNNRTSMDPTIVSNIGGAFKYINPTMLLVDLAFTNSYFLLIGYVATNVVAAIIIIILFASLFTFLHEVTSSAKMKVKYVRKDLKIQNEFKTLYGIEMKRLLNSKMYFINSLLGVMMSILAVVVSNLTTMSVTANPDARDTFILVIVPACIGVAMFVLGISNPASCSINIEGKTFWLTKTLPINKKKYMLAKLALNYTFFIPASLITSTIIVIFHHEYLFASIMAYVIPLLFVIVSGLIALNSNARHIKLKWKSEQEAVKNAPSVVFTMLWGFLYSGVLTGIMIPLVLLVNIYLAYLLVAGILLILIVVYYIHLNRTFERHIELTEDL